MSRILVHGPPPFADSGYAVLTAQTAAALRELGHEVAISAWGSAARGEVWEGIPVLSCGGRNHGNGLVGINYRRHAADAVIVVTDNWLLGPDQFGGLTVYPWMPVDCTPLSVLDRSWLGAVAKTAAAVHPVAMSQFGTQRLAEAGYPGIPVVPAAAQPEYKPDPEAGRAWREEMRIPRDTFVVAKVGVNSDDDRKCFGVSLPAFAELTRRHRDVVMYCHTEPQKSGSANLVVMAMDLGLKGWIRFADESRYAVQDFDAAWMAGMYNGADVLDAVSQAEGLCLPAVEALACGTPVIAARNSAMPEKIRPDQGWLVSGQKFRPRHHNAWWMTPFTAGVTRAYEQARTSARSMRKAAAAAGAGWSTAAVTAAWEKTLAGLD